MRHTADSNNFYGSMVGYRRQKYLVIWVLVILVLTVFFYYYFTSDSKTGGPLKNFTLILATTTTRTSIKGELGNWLQPYSNAVQFNSVWFKKNCLETLTDSEGIGNLGKLVHAWKNALSTDCRHLYSKFSDIYFVRDRTAPLKIPDTFFPKVLKWLGGKQELVKEAYLQHITSVDNKYTQESTVFNPLRGKRPGAGGGASEKTKKYVAELVQSSAKDCDFCNHKINTAQDPFERVESKYSVSVSNTFKVEKFHGLILLKHHNPLEVNEVMLLDGMDTAQKWFHRAHLYDQQYTVPHIYWDTLPRASASQVHPHFHVSLADHYYARWAHFQAAAKEYAAKHNGENYFAALNQIYSALGLAAQHGNATVVAYLTPSASHEIMLFSKEPSKQLFQLLFYCLAALRNDMELYAISAGMVFPKLIPSPDGSDLPAIIRLVYRGPAEAMRADIDSLQLFGTGNVNVDPYSVISNIKKSIAKRKGPL